jgi:aromatic-L-amino-acid decarboxylase
MRRLGYRVVDMLVDHFETLPDKKVTRKGNRPDLERVFVEAMPDKPMDGEELLDLVENEVFTHIMHLDHPRFFAFVPGPSNYISALADALVTGFNVFSSTWLESSSAAQIEMVTVDWLRAACGLPEDAGGIFVSGGSMANITALAVARHVRLDDEMDNAIVYCSDQTHSSVERGMAVLGFRSDQLRKLPSDATFRMDLSALHRAVAEDRAADRRPFCVVANAGTTNTGTVDPLTRLSELCHSAGLWLHVDGAYGAAAALSERGRSQLVGLELADSIAIDPHKWLFQPYEIGCTLVRDEKWLRQTFHILPEYLADIERESGEVNFCDRGVQLTRTFRALKLWMSVKRFGRSAFAAAIDRGFALAEYAQTCIESQDCWEIVSPAQMGILAFRYVPAGKPQAADVDKLQHRIVDLMIEDGFAMVATTALRGKTVLRMCTINPRTSEADIRASVERMDRLANDLNP